MTYKFSKTSLDNLHGVHPRLIDTVMDVMELQFMDFGVREGVRTYEKQKEYFAKGVSKTLNSKHLKQRDGYGHAVDLYPSPIRMDLIKKNDGRELIRFGVLAGLMKSCSEKNGIVLTWGYDWDNDGQTLDHTFFDAPHFEIYKVL